MGQITTSFCGQRLRIGRKFRALTQSGLAQKVSASTALISLCEAGKNKRHSHDFVEACGAVLGFEPAFFYAPLEDVFQEDECNFRHRGTTQGRIKAQIRAHGTLIGFVIQTLRSRRLFPPIIVPRAAASSNEQIELAAEYCRQHWNLGLDGPVPRLRTVLEEAGVIVIDHVSNQTK
jgi:DNA-binding XRE family transcriptional regulator